MFKIEFCLHGSAARLLRIPRPEFPDTVDLASRLGVRQDRVKVGRLIEAEIVHVEMVNVEGMRCCSGILWKRDEYRVIRYDLADHKWKLFRQIHIGSVNQRLSARLSRWRVNLQPVQVHAADGQLVSQQ